MLPSATLGAVLSILLSIGLAAPPAAAASVETLWGSATPPGLIKHDDRAGVELGTRFQIATSGLATGMRFYKTPAGAATHTGTLWTSSGQKLATATFRSETSSGWQTATFANPVALTRGQTYVVSYFAPNGGYAVTPRFSGQSASPALRVGAGAGVFRYGGPSQFPHETYQNNQYWVDVTFAPQSVAPTPSPTATPKPTVSPTPPTSSGGFPSASSTGVPAGTALSGYTGPCTVTTANTVIDAKTINCSLTIRAKGVVISRSVVNGTVYGDTNGSSSFTIKDSTVNIGARMGTGIGDAYFTATRVHVTGGNRSINCFLNCTVEASYVHGQFRDSTGKAHESGIRMGSNSVIRGNTIACDAPDVPPDAGCSAALTGYGDYAVVQNNTIDRNLFIAGSGGYCTYGGSSPGKPYSSGTNNIRFTNNVWQRGSNAKCGYYGPITSFNSNAPGNVWSNNVWDDGKPVAPAN